MHFYGIDRAALERSGGSAAVGKESVEIWPARFHLFIDCWRRWWYRASLTYVRIYVYAGLTFSINHFLSILPSERSNLGTKISHRYRYQYFSMVSSRDIGGAGWWDERMGDVGGRRECDIYRPVGTPAQLKISN